MRPRYYRANRSHCLYTRHWHLYVFRGQSCSRGIQSGLTLKHRRGDGCWRHWMLRRMRYDSTERGYGVVRHYEFSWHLSAHARSQGNRVKGSKRYFRFKVCL